MMWNTGRLVWKEPYPSLTPEVRATSTQRCPNFISPLKVMVLFAIIASLASFVYFYTNDQTLAYPDAISHLLISKRIIDSPTPGLGQGGAVWLILTHIAMLPFIQNDSLFYTGIAGSVIGMASFVGTVPYLYKITERIGGGTKGGIIASFVFILNPNVLYMQSTPMTELPLFFFLAGALYYFIRWTEDTERLRFLSATSLMLVGATLTRYEAWVFLAIITALIPFICWKKQYSWGEIRGFTIWSSTFSYIGIVSWLVWNFIIADHPLYFQIGEYAKPALWVGDNEETVGNFSASLLTYWYGMAESFNPLLLAMAIIGAIYFLVKSRSAPIQLAVLILLFPLPFFVLALFEGQRPMHVVQVSNDLYNVRFALIMVLAVAVFTGYLASKHLLVSMLVLLVTAGISASAFQSDNIVTLNDPLTDRKDETFLLQLETARWLKENYDGGNVLSESFGNEIVQFESRIPTTRIIYEGSYQLWEPSLAHPDQYVDWVIMRTGSMGKDKVAQSLEGTDALVNFEPTVINKAYTVYRRTESSP